MLPQLHCIAMAASGITRTPSDSSFLMDVAEALVTPTGTSAFLLEDVNRYCDVTEAECFDGISSCKPQRWR